MDRVLVEGINVAKKHVKGNPNAGEQGGIIDKEMPIDVSNVMVFNPKTEEGRARWFRVEDDGSKVRVFRRAATWSTFEGRSTTTRDNMARLQEKYKRRLVQAPEEAGPRERHGSAEDHQDHAEHGRG